MSQGFYTAISGIQSSQQKIDVISDNIANINTAGFKESMINFSDVYYKTLSSGAAPTNALGGQNGMQIGLGTKTSSITKNYSAGANQSTGVASDLYLDGPGFFCVEGANNEILMTRAGNFSVDSDGYLVTSNGNRILGTDSSYSVQGSQTPVRIPPMLTLNTKGNSDNTELMNSKLEDLNALSTTGKSITMSKSTSEPDFEIEITCAGGVTRIIPVNVYGSKSLQEIIDKCNTAIATDYPGIDGAGVTIGASVPADGTLSITINKSFSATTVSGTSIKQISAVQVRTKACNLFDEAKLAAVAGTNSNPLDPGAGTITYKSKVLDYEASVSPADNIVEASKLASYKIGADGAIIATYANGDSLTAQLQEGTKNIQLIYKTAGGVGIESNDISIDANVISASNLQLQLGSVVNDKGLIAVGNNNFIAGPNAGDVMFSTASNNGFARVVGGALESSNVDLTKQFAELIVAQRSIEANSRTFDTVSRVLQGLIQMGR